jgi:hypothetical protein
MKLSTDGCERLVTPTFMDVRARIEYGGEITIDCI